VTDQARQRAMDAGKRAYGERNPGPRARCRVVNNSATCGCSNRSAGVVSLFRVVLYKRSRNFSVLGRIAGAAARAGPTTGVALSRIWNRPSLWSRESQAGAGARRGDRLGISDCRRTVRDRLADRPEVDARTGVDRPRHGDGGRLSQSAAASSFWRSGTSRSAPPTRCGPASAPPEPSSWGCGSSATPAASGAGSAPASSSPA
jgi:hypothetical protein